MLTVVGTGNEFSAWANPIGTSQADTIKMRRFMQVHIGIRTLIMRPDSPETGYHACCYRTGTSRLVMVNAGPFGFAGSGCSEALFMGFFHRVGRLVVQFLGENLHQTR